MNWPTVNIGNVAKIIGGYAFKSKDFEKSGYPIIRISNVQNGLVDISKAARIPQDKIGKGLKYRIEPGSLLIAMSGATTGKVGRYFPINEESAYLNQRVGKFECNKSLINPEYLWFFTHSSICQKHISFLAEGAAQANISGKQIESIQIPLPPLETQKQIAAVLEKADQLRKDCQQMEQELNRLAQSVFIEMFGDPVTNPKGWNIKNLIDLLLCKPQIGTITPSHEDGRQKVIRVGELGNHEANYKKCGGITLKGKEFERYRLFEDDYLLARAIGSRNHLGKASLFIEQDNDYVYDSHVMRLRFNKNLMSSKFFYELMKTNGGRTLFLNNSAQTAVQFNINAKQISLIRLPIPPQKLQRQFLSTLNEIRMLLKINNTLTHEYKFNFNALMQKAFKGELTLTDKKNNNHVKEDLCQIKIHSEILP